MTQEASSVISSAAESALLGEHQSIARFIAVVGEVIGVDNISAGDHFLDVGGDSLSAAILIDWIAQEFGVEPELDWFFDSQTVEELAGKWWGKVEAQRVTVPADE
jgi:acyl carrier protein